MRRGFSVFLVVAFLGLAVPAHAAWPPTNERNIQAVDYIDLLNNYYLFGCLTGAALGSGAGYQVIAGPSSLFSAYAAYFTAFAVSGCGIGMMAGPVGLMVHDAVTGDNTIRRYVNDNWYPSAE